MAKTVPSCVDCGTNNCNLGGSSYPDWCLGERLSAEQIAAIIAEYQEDEQNLLVTVEAAKIEGEFYCQITRLEEIIKFCQSIKAQKIGIATCIGLIEESRILAKVLRAHGLQVFGVLCKVGAIEKAVMGLTPEDYRETGPHMCNPILQAKILNQVPTDFNVVMGLCVGHDSLFTKYAEALTTTLVAKDRVLGHNPAAALYTAHTYYKKKLAAPEAK